MEALREVGCGATSLCSVRVGIRHPRPARPWPRRQSRLQYPLAPPALLLARRLLLHCRGHPLFLSLGLGCRCRFGSALLRLLRLLLLLLLLLVLVLVWRIATCYCC